MKTKLPFATCPGVSLCGFNQPTLALLFYFLIGSSPCLHAQSQWYLRHPLPTPNGLLGATYGNGQFVAVGFFGTVLTSPDAVTWTSRLPERDGILEDVAYGNGRFVAVGGKYDWDSTTVLTSTEGTVWADGEPVNGFHLLRLVFANGLFVGFGITVDADFGNLPVIVTSPDGWSWTERWRGTERRFSNWPDSWPESSMVAVGNESIVVNIASQSDGSESFLVSTNGLSWVEVPTGLSSGNVSDLSFGSGKFVAVVYEASTTGNIIMKVLLSGDGFAWESLTVRENWQGGVYGVGFGNGSFVILANLFTNDVTGGQVVLPIALTSPDGRSWTEHSRSGLGFDGKDEIHTVSKLIHAQNTFVIVGQPQAGQGGRNNFARIFTSPEGINWTRRVDVTLDLFGGAAGDRGLVAISSSYGDPGPTALVLTSTNGTDWRETQRLDGQYLSSIVYGSGLFVAAGDTGIYTSPDGASWARQTNAGAGWGRLRYGVGKFLVLGGEVDTNGTFHSKFGSSFDGLTWVNGASPTAGMDAATDGKSVVLVDRGNVIWRSTDGSSWAEVYRGSKPSPSLVAFGNDRFVAVGGGSTALDSVLTSTDGTDWKTHGGFTESAIGDLIFVNGRFYAVEYEYGISEARVFSSPDGVQWRAHPTGFHQTLGSLAAGPQGLFAFGSGGVILHSPWDLLLTAPERALNGNIRIYVTGPPSANVQLQRGSALGDWADWQTVTLDDGPVPVEDADVTGSSRFYRAVTR